MATAVKLDPHLWAEAKRRGVAAMGGRHSARAMQWAVRYYKAHGGRYRGTVPRRRTGLAKWTREKWRTASGRPSCDRRDAAPGATGRPRIGPS